MKQKASFNRVRRKQTRLSPDDRRKESSPKQRSSLPSRDLGVERAIWLAASA